MTCWQDAHAAAFLSRRGQGEPDRDQIARIEAPVAQILMPGHKALAASFLDPEQRIPAEQVGADQILYRIQNRLLPHEIVDPLEQQVRLVALGASNGFPLGGFESLQIVSVCAT